MFWYAIHLFPEIDHVDGCRFTEDRGAAIVAMIVLRLEVRVLAKPI